MQVKCAKMMSIHPNRTGIAYMQNISKKVSPSPLHREVEEQNRFTNKELEDLYQDAWQKGYDSRKEEETRAHNSVIENYDEPFKFVRDRYKRLFMT